MSTQIATGFAVTNRGGIPLKTTVTDGSNSQELKTNDTYTVTSQSIGTFAEGATLTHLGVNCATGMCWAGILRNGTFIALCQSLRSIALGGGHKYAPILPAPVLLQAGDQLLVRTEA
jgi:hypothetical protein